MPQKKEGNECDMNELTCVYRSGVSAVENLADTSTPKVILKTHCLKKLDPKDLK
jgi:hypothetical protein